MTTCSFQGCNRDSTAKSYCLMHYKRWRKHGDASVVNRTQPGFGTKGYKFDYASGRQVHVAVAERALGRRLPKGACVHHVDENRRNNDPTNLVICPDNAYHRLLHKRMAAYDACGHADWLKCPFCKQYDAPSNLVMRERSGRPGNFTWHHAKCKAEHSKEKRRKS